MTFNGQPLFGLHGLRCEGPVGKARLMQERLPGVDGFRVYRLAKDSAVFVATGRIYVATAGALEATLLTAARYVMNGTIGQFVTTAGGRYANCLMTDYHETTPKRRLQNGAVTVRVQATIVWMAPA